MELFINQVLAGVSTGAIYACMALAVVMIYQAIDHLNFAQGEMAMFSTFIAWQLMQWGMPYWWAFLITLAVSFAGGILIERLLFKPLAKAPVLTNVAGFIALFAIVNSVAGLTWDFTIKQFPTPFGSSPFLGSQLISTHQAGMIGVTLLMLVGLYAFFQFTRIGLAMRAAAALPESARLVGINTSWMIALGWGMASAIGAVAGILIAPVVFLEPNMMGGVLVYGFAAAVLGGLTSPLGAVVGGFLMGVFENLVGTYIPGVGNELKLPIALALIITVLVFKPAGLFGRPIIKRVLIMSAAEEVVTEGQAVEAVPKRAMTLGFGTSLVILALALVSPAVREKLRRLPDDDGPGLRDRGAGAQHPDRRLGPVLARPERVLRGRRLYDRGPDGTWQRQLCADAADRRAGLVRRRAICSASRRCGCPAFTWRWPPSRSRSPCRSS